MTDGPLMDAFDDSVFEDCPECGGTGSIGSCAVEDLEPDQSPVEAWGWGCDTCSGTGVVLNG